MIEHVLLHAGEVVLHLRQCTVLRLYSSIRLFTAARITWRVGLARTLPEASRRHFGISRMACSSSSCRLEIIDTSCFCSALAPLALVGLVTLSIAHLGQSQTVGLRRSASPRPLPAPNSAIAHTGARRTRDRSPRAWCGTGRPPSQRRSRRAGLPPALHLLREATAWPLQATEVRCLCGTSLKTWPHHFWQVPRPCACFRVAARRVAADARRPPRDNRL